jgi:four helix bundle protein
MVNKIKYQKVEEVPVWKKTHELVLAIYVLTRKFPGDELYGIVSQLRRSSSSIAANITEGFYRGTTKQLIQFLFNARGSLGESIYFVRLSKDLDYINQLNYNTLMLDFDDIGKQLNGWIKSLQSRIRN